MDTAANTDPYAIIHLRVIRDVHQTLIPPSLDRGTVRDVSRIVSSSNAEPYFPTSVLTTLSDITSSLADQLRLSSTVDKLVCIELLTDNPSGREVHEIYAVLKHTLSTIEEHRVSVLLLGVERRSLVPADVLREFASLGPRVALVDRTDVGAIFELRDDQLISLRVETSQLLWALVDREVLPRDRDRPAEISLSDLSPLFGHYRFDSGSRRFHTNLILQLGSLAKDDAGMFTIAVRARSLVETKDFVVVPDGIYQRELNRIGLSIVEGELHRVVSDSLAECLNREVLILVDTLGENRGLEALLQSILAQDPSRVVVYALTATTRRPNLDCDVGVLFDLPPIAMSFDASACLYCDEGDVVVPADNSRPVAIDRDYERVASIYSPSVFWDLMSWDDAFCQVGHWRSKATENHFSLRIQCREVFDTFAYSVALRIKAGLEAHGILPNWIDGLICTDGVESTNLVPELRDLLALPDSAVLEVPSRLLRQSSESGIGPGLEAWLTSEEGAVARTIAGRNVILIDQAAHHFVTYSALRRLGRHLGCTCLAFSVLVSRTDDPEAIALITNDMHFMPLFSWDNPSWTRKTCPCGITA